MASASRPSRKSARISSPVPANVNGNNAPPSAPLNEDHQRTPGTWVEPPLKAPAPSFMDHKGFERVGVLEGMMPLGSFPTAKLKAKARADPLRKSVQIRRLDSGRGGSARATPENIPVTDASRSSPPPEDEAIPFSLNNSDQATGQSHAPERQKSSSRSRQNSQQLPSLPSTPVTNTRHTNSPGLPPHIEKAFNIAFEQAKDESNGVRSKILRKLLDEASEPDFRATLSAVTSPPRANGPDPAKEFDRKVKEVKKKVRTQLSLSPAKLAPAPAPAEYDWPQKLKISSPAAALSYNLKSSSATPTLRISQPNTQNKTRHTSLPRETSPSTSSLSGSLLRKNLGAATTTMSQTAADSKPADKLSRRSSSSSSLSSVDEALVEQPLPALNNDDGTFLSADSAGDASFNGNSRSSLKRSSADIAQEELLEAKRRKLRRTFDDYKVTESNVRPPLRTLRLSRPADKSRPSPALGIAKTLSFSNVNANGDLVSPTSDNFHGESSDLSGQVTPDFGLGRPPKKPKTSARIKMSPLKKKSAVVAGLVRPESRRGGSVGYDDNSEQSDNNDYCSACHGSGYLLCCDGCDRSFHFSCLDPPLDQEAALDEPWFCYICKAKQEPPPSQPRGLFAELIHRIIKKNPTAFQLPDSVRDYFEGVRTGEDGEYEETSLQKNSTRGRMGYDEQPDFRKVKDSKGKTILCYRCGKSSLDGRDIIPCDWCSLHWHLDCLSPPLANPPNRSGFDSKVRQAWMCPNHSEHDLRHLDPVQLSGVSYDGIARTHRVRRPKNAKITDTALRRGHRNNGLIEVESSSEEEDGFTEDEYEDEDGPQIRRLPRRGIKLDFIDKVKSTRAVRYQAEAARAQTAAANAAELSLLNAQAMADNQTRLTEELRRRSFLEQKTVLNLVQFANQNTDLNLGPSEIDDLINALTAESPVDVVSKMTESEVAAAVTRKPSKTAVPPSPPASDQPDSATITETERSKLLKLQELIRRKLELTSTSGT